MGIVVALAGAALMPASAAAATPALPGELLFYSNSSGFFPSPPLPTDAGTVDLSTTCDGTGTGALDYVATGNANGLLQGAFIVSGSASLVAGVVQSLDVSFDVDASGSDGASGSLSLDPLGTEVAGTCSVSTFDWDGDDIDDVVTDVSISGWVDYNASTTLGGTTQSESGEALWQVSCFMVNAEPPCVESATSRVWFAGATRPRQADGTGSASTRSAATADDPIATSVTGPASSQIVIEEAIATPWVDSGFTLLGRELDISVYDENFEDLIAPADDPLVVTFTVFTGRLDELGIAPNDVLVLRDGSPAQVCAAPGTANPDPCIESRTVLGDQLTLVVLSTHASRWSVAAESEPSVDYQVEGFYSPVVNPGANNELNLIRAGQSVPLKWRLLANGQPVLDLASAAVTTTNYSCGRAVTADVSARAPGKSGLKNLGNGYYQLNWQSPKSYANSCKTMTLTLQIGSDSVTKTALFEFRK